jgi:repressor LexA
MKQADIVEATKIGKSSISTYLTGEYEPKQRNVYRIAKALNVNEAWLMGHDVPMEHTLPPGAIPVPKMRKIPVLGSIRAGLPVLAEENIESYEYADVPEGQEFFFLRVKGDSMNNARICDGDLVLIKQQPCANDGQIVACLVNGDEATLKRFYRQKDMVILKPENAAYSPIIVPCSDFESGHARILGVVTKVEFRL